MYKGVNCVKKGLIYMMTIFIMFSGLYINRGEVEALDSGDLAKVSLGKSLVGVENIQYVYSFNGSSIFYNIDGSTYIENVKNQPMDKKKYMILTNAKGEKNKGYCIEFNTEIRGEAGYTGSNHLDDVKYYNNLPEDVRKMIVATTFYGENGNNKVPVSGANEEDYYFATQILIWEIQQQLRIFERDKDSRIIGTVRVGAHNMDADFFFKYIKGRAAEKCYNHIVENIENHFVTPAFIGEKPDRIEPILLKYQMESKSWKASIDAEGLAYKPKLSDNGVIYSSGENTHNFEVKSYSKNEKTIRVRRFSSEGSSSDNLLIWNNDVDEKYQVLVTGSAHPTELYMKIKTDIPSDTTIKKHDDETDKVVPLPGTNYKVKNVELNQFISKDMKNPDGDIYPTDKEGRVTVDEKLQAGNYILKEVKAPKGYVVAKEDLTFNIDGNTEEAEVIQANTPQKGKIIISKMGEYKYKEDWADIRERAMGGIDFDIIALADIVTPDGTIRHSAGDVVDTVRTDFNGNVSSKELYLGPYNIVEKTAPDEYKIMDPINVALVYSGQDVEVVEKKINIFNRLNRDKKDYNIPKTGDDNPISHILLVGITLTIISLLGVSFVLKEN